MADTITANYSWVKPEPHASPLDWGVKLNADLDLIDAKVYQLDQGYTAGNRLVLNKTTVAAGNPIIGQLNGSNRWVVEVGDGTAETGSNAGSNFAIFAYNDAGAYINTPFVIYRANANAVFAGVITCRASINAVDFVIITASSTSSSPVFSVNSSTGAQKGYFGWLQSGDYLVVQKSGGAGLTLTNSGITASMPLTVVGALNATAAFGCKNAALISAIGISDAYAGFMNAAGTRQGFCGWLASGSLVTLAKDGGANIQLGAGITLNGVTTINGATTVASLTSSNTVTAPQIACNNASGTSSFYGLTATFLNTSGSVNIAGNLTVSGVISNPSDARIKSVINDYDAGLTDLLRLRPVVYRYKGNDGETHKQVAAEHKSFIGLVAQEAELVMPELVSYSKGVIDGVEVDDLRSLNSAPLIFALINAVKDLSLKIETMQGELDELRLGR